MFGVPMASASSPLGSIMRTQNTSKWPSKNCKEAILYHPEWLFEYASALEWLGSLSDEDHHYARAIDIFSHVLLIDPDFPHIHHRIALCYSEIGHIASDPESYKRAIHFFR